MRISDESKRVLFESYDLIEKDIQGLKDILNTSEEITEQDLMLHFNSTKSISTRLSNLSGFIRVIAINSKEVKK